MGDGGRDRSQLPTIRVVIRLGCGFGPVFESVGVFTRGTRGDGSCYGEFWAFFGAFLEDGGQGQ